MFYVSIDFVISILEAVCCQMFFDIFADENWENRGKGIKSCIIMALGLVYFGMGKLLSTDFLILKEAIVIAATAVIMILIAGFELKKAAILASLFQGLLLAMEYLAYIFMQIIVSDETNVSNMEGTLSTFIAIIDMLLLFLCVVLIRRMFKGQKNRILYDEEWLKFIIFPVFTVITLAAFITSFKSIEDVRQIRMLYIISLGLIMMNFFVFYLLEDTLKREKRPEKWRFLNYRGESSWRCTML